MATIVLQAAGAFVGGVFGSVGSAIGSAAGALAGYAIDRALIDSTRHYEGPRLAGAAPFTAEEGAPLARAYGTVRIGGTMIWGTRFEEKSTTTRQGGKGGPKTTSYSYFANAAFALCEGEIAGVRRIWADGREIDRTRFDIRIYNGTGEQMPDPLVEAKQGEGNAPAYRGTAYAVIERFPIDDYGRRLPQFQFEVLRPVGALHGHIRSVALIPGSTEYGLSPEAVTRSRRDGETEGTNRHTLTGASDLEASLDELQMLCPNLESVSLVVAWFGDDLRAGECTIRPLVTQSDPAGFSQDWVVSGTARQNADRVSQVDGGAAYGGTPSDKSVVAAIRDIRARGLKVTLYPFVMMDVPADNALPDPYGGSAQPAYPWRGRITCDPAPGRDGTVDGTAEAGQQIAHFLGDAAAGDFQAGSDTVAFTGATEWSYRRLVLHYAKLAVLAGGIDGFLIGSEMRGLTTVRDGEGAFPFVDGLRSLAAEMREILGEEPMVTYGADWSEYFGHQPQDGSGDVIFHLDPLWADPAIDAVGIDNYMPLADWRDADYGGGNPDGAAGPYAIDVLRGAIVSGEGFDWYYASEADRSARLRTPIADGTYGKDWVFRYKDIASWWSNEHFDRHGGIEATEKTAWVPGSKPVLFTELGCGAVDKGPNQPNVFPDPKSSENGLPHFSSGGRSDFAQRRFLEAHYNYWGDAGSSGNPNSPIDGSPMVSPADICVWAWDARPFPAFPLRSDYWRDGDNWALGHWLNGRLSGVSVGDLINAILADHGLPDAVTSTVEGTVDGYIVDAAGTARAALEPVASLFSLEVMEDADGLHFTTAGRGEAIEIDPAQLVLSSDGPVVSRSRDAERSLPARVQLDFRDAMNDHQAASADVSRVGLGANTQAFVSFPGVLAKGTARALIDDWLRARWAGRETLAISLAPSPGISPGTVLRFGGDGKAEYLVDQVETGLTTSVKARRLVRVAPSPWRPEAGVEGGGTDLVVGRPLALLLDLPTTDSARAAQEQLRLAVRARPWRAQISMVSPEDTGFEARGEAAKRATIGALREAMPGGGIPGRIDRSTRPVVELFDGELSSVSRLAMLNGANAAAIMSRSGVWEILQFQTAEEIEPSVWQLGSLLRGQLGSDDAMSSGADAGASFVLLDDAVVPAGLRAAETGLALNWRIGPVGYDLSDRFFAELTVVGGMRAQLPLSPVHLRARPQPGGDILFSWIRRGRIDADDWLAADIPLGEVLESYQIDVSDQEGVILRARRSRSPHGPMTRRRFHRICRVGRARFRSRFARSAPRSGRACLLRSS